MAKIAPALQRTRPACAEVSFLSLTASPSAAAVVEEKSHGKEVAVGKEKKKPSSFAEHFFDLERVERQQHLNILSLCECSCVGSRGLGRLLETSSAPALQAWPGSRERELESLEP